MTLLTIAEILAGETLVTPGGPIDRLTAVHDEQTALWASPHAIPIASAEDAAGAPVEAEQLELVSV